MVYHVLELNFSSSPAQNTGCQKNSKNLFGRLSILYRKIPLEDQAFFIPNFFFGTKHFLFQNSFGGPSIFYLKNSLGSKYFYFLGPKQHLKYSEYPTINHPGTIFQRITYFFCCPSRILRSIPYRAESIV
jgi:hypothetical protein